MRPGEHYGFLPYAQEFHVRSDVRAAVAVATANPEYGPGGGQRVFIPANVHPYAIEPVGELIPLHGYSEPCDDNPLGVVRDIIDLEVRFGNRVVGADRVQKDNGRRFWMQEPLHVERITRELDLPPSTVAFEDLDIYGSVVGLISTDESQMVGGPVERESKKKSWLSGLLRRGQSR